MLLDTKGCAPWLGSVRGMLKRGGEGRRHVHHAFLSREGREGGSHEGA